MGKSDLIRLGERAPRKTHVFDVNPDLAALAALADDMGLVALSRVRLSGELRPEGRDDWRLEARLLATVVQPCVITLAPVTTRLDEAVARHFLAEFSHPTEDEAEMPAEAEAEPIPDSLDLMAVLAEALTLALPLYPRVPGAELGALDAGPGQPAAEPPREKPFAGLGAMLRGKAKTP